MNALLLVLRLLHIGLGAFWFGAHLFASFFLFPSMEEAGPDSAKVGAGIMRRHYPQIVAMFALLTVLSGIWLLWRVSGGFQPEYMQSGPGRGLQHRGRIRDSRVSPRGDHGPAFDDEGDAAGPGGRDLRQSRSGAGGSEAASGPGDEGRSCDRRPAHHHHRRDGARPLPVADRVVPACFAGGPPPGHSPPGPGRPGREHDHRLGDLRPARGGVPAGGGLEPAGLRGLRRGGLHHGDLLRRGEQPVQRDRRGLTSTPGPRSDPWSGSR